MLYDANYDSELQQERIACKELCYDYNALRPSQRAEQTALLQKLLGKTKGAFTVIAPFWCDYGYNIELGENFFANHGCVILDCARVTFGDNVFVAAVSGNFDDCQRAVKKLFVDGTFNAELLKKNTRLSSANSINFGRLAPQIAYYFSAYLDMLSAGRIEEGETVDFVVPTGNFGNILAGWYAKRMGLPIRKLLCSSNRNKVLADFFTTGKYDIKRNCHRTMSPSMDMLVSSNLERLLFEVSGHNAKQTADRMKNLAEKGEYSITTAEKAKIDEDFYGGFASEDDTVEAMYELFEEYGYPMDTHTGVALAVYAEYADKKDKKDFTSTVVLSTGNPYKFPQDVLYALSGNDVKDSFKGVKRLNLLTAMKPPKCLVDLRYRPLRFKKVYPCDMKKISAAVLDFADGNIIPVPDKK